MSDYRELLNAALEGLLLEQSRVDEEILVLRRELRPKQETPGPRRLQQMSAAGRARIAAAQKNRWAAFREKKKQA